MPQGYDIFTIDSESVHGAESVASAAPPLPVPSVVQSWTQVGGAAPAARRDAPMLAGDDGVESLLPVDKDDAKGRRDDAPSVHNKYTLCNCNEGAVRAMLGLCTAACVDGGGGDDDGGGGGGPRRTTRMRNMILLAWWLWFAGATITAISLHVRLGQADNEGSWAVPLLPLWICTSLSMVIVVLDILRACYRFRSRAPSSYLHSAAMAGSTDTEESMKVGARNRVISDSVGIILGVIVFWLSAHLTGAANDASSGHWEAARAQCKQAMYALYPLIAFGVGNASIAMIQQMQEQVARVRNEF